MGDQIQHQLAQLVNLFQEERAANLARHEATNARLDALTQDLANSKVDSDSTEHISQNRGWKESDLPQLSWDDFKRHCNLRFGPPIRSQKLGELAKLRQIGSVADYQETFEQLISRAGTLTQSQKIELYISGLTDYIAIEVELHNPPDLATAMNACKSKTADFSPQQHVRFVKKLTRSEMEERRLKGLCFNCDEPFTRGHQCKKLFWIDFINDEEELLSTLSA
ncbi:hypothetical protein KY290_021370 [Solanum tuberosum]|uniref:Ty3 transposon capsid-like protein domain-containing protein n=1 Tax=Solanum tuberosum TaxID=4113 RepID=A0ABQ7V1D1_SOLTU|nr:hypothetical protein KY285_020295 [Solanum tuberosum]KAH0757877.1 hypothetical protein KY290_021370 [Solanum tuberosum]